MIGTRSRWPKTLEGCKLSTDLSELYTWTETDPRGGEGTIVAIVPGMGSVNLITRKREIAEGAFLEVAWKHHKASGHRVRLVRWTKREDLQQWG
jgi:hypothetical protein